MKEKEIAKKKILVVDDEEDIFDLVSQILAPLGHETIYADNGTVGFLKAKQEKPSLIILDISMPLMDGFEVQRLLKEYEPTHHIPVLFLTGSTIFQYKPLALEQGAVGYLQKPIHEDLLLKNVKTLLDVGEQLARLKGIKKEFTIDPHLAQ